MRKLNATEFTKMRRTLFLIFLALGNLSAQATPPTPSVPARLVAKAGETGFVAGTPVATEKSSKLVEAVKAGDRIWTMDLHTRKSIQHKVIELSAEDASGLVDVLTASRERIETTPASRFWVNTKGWIAAKALFPGDQLLERDGSFTKVFNVIPKYGAKAKVYNVRLDKVFTYYVGKAGILVSATSK